MALTIYGGPNSRATRTLWMAEELGLAYDRVADVGPDDLARLNPMMQVPVIDDDGFVLAESMAINFYLAKKHDQLMPPGIEAEASALRWSFWAMTAVEPALLEVIYHTHGFLGRTVDLERANARRHDLDRPFAALNRFLSTTEHLVGSGFSVADLNVASVMSLVSMGNVSLAEYPVLKNWLRTCLLRDACRRVNPYPVPE